jgi:hypothetical protein
MIIDREVAMVNAASAALEYKARHPRCYDDEAVSHVLKTLEAEKKLKVYGIAAANEVLNLRKEPVNRNLTDKQILQLFVDNIFAITAKIDANIK